MNPELVKGRIPPLNTVALSSRVQAIQASPTLAITAKVRQLRQEGHDVISFAAGEPDFNTPEPICDAAIDAIRRGMTKYTASSGIPELKAAICDKLWRENQLRYQPEQIIVSCGAKHSMYNAFMCLIEPGDEVILLAPFWMTYEDQVKLAGGKPVIVHGDPSRDFAPSLDDLRAAITPRTKAIVLNSPCNPTGAVLDRGTLKEIAALALRHDFWIISDEIYERLTYGATAESIATLSDEVKERTIVVNGCSKSYAMTGWRIGYSAAPTPVAKAMSNLQDQVTSNPTTFAQQGAVHALQMPSDAVEAMRAEFQDRRDLGFRLLQQIDGIQTRTPNGAFYLFPRIQDRIAGRFESDLAFCTFLLERFHVATVPGSVFYGPGHLRLSYTASQPDIERGIARIREALDTAP